MFTGITTDVGTVASAEQRANSDLRLTIRCAYDMGTVDLGASIACSGVCFTVVDKGDDWFAVDVSAETLSKTAGQLWHEGAQLNLERSLRIGDELGGHIVSGHVDGVAEVIAVRPDAGSSPRRPARAGIAGAIPRSKRLDHPRRRVADGQRGPGYRQWRPNFRSTSFPTPPSALRFGEHRARATV